ncbi:MAG TPA: hypothetical protein PKN36_10415 [bacterium]|nr:hypothetical protein [bacterium]
MRKAILESKKGMALIMVLVMIIIFSSLILAVVISSSTAIRRAHFYKDKTLALQVAEAGIQDVFSWMNYSGYYTQYYPCTNTSTGAYDQTLKYFQGSDHTGTDTWTAAEPSSYNPAGIPGAKCIVQFSDEDESETANLDTVTSTGYYRGRAATVSVRIRGRNGRGNPFHTTSWRVLRDIGYTSSNWTKGVATWGIPEDFNKHTVFSHAADSAAASITGNISYRESSTFPASGSQWTKGIVSYPVTEDSIVRVESSLYIPVPPGPSIPMATYHDTGLAPYPATYDPDGTAGPAPEVTVYAANCFEFTDGDTIIVPIEIRGDARFQGNMSINGYVKISAEGSTTGAVAIRGNVMVRSFVEAEGIVAITEQARVLPGSSVCIKGQGINITSDDVQIESGLIYSTDNITVNAANTFPFTATFFAEGGNSDFTGGCLLGTEGSPVDIVTIGNASVGLRGVTLNGTVYSQDSIWIGTANNTIAANRDTGVALILDRAAVGESSSITTANTSDTITGLIYARGGGSKILLNNDTVTGLVVTDGTAQYIGTVIQNFDAQNFKDIPEVYKNFKGGRRRYLPAPGSWTVTW